MNFKRHKTLLNPETQRRVDSSEYTFSPLAQYSSAMIQEHQAALERLASERAKIQRSISELAASEAEAKRHYEDTMHALALDEANSMDIIRSSRQMVLDLESQSAEMSTENQRNMHELDERRRKLEAEIEELAEIENKLHEMRQSAEERLELVSSQRLLNSKEFQESISMLERDRMETRSTILQVPQTSGEGPPRVRSPELVQTPPRRPLDSRHGELQPLPWYVAPRATQNAPTGPTFIAEVHSPGRSAYNRAITSPSVAGRDTISRPAASSHSLPPIVQVQMREAAREPGSPPHGAATPKSSYLAPSPTSAARFETGGLSQLGPSGRTPLHSACASTPHDVSAILNLIKMKPSLVDELDMAGDTPLHCACSAANPSLEAVHALLLAGSSTSVRNADGLTAFHYACLNITDTNHRLKKFLILKGGQNPNQRTARGETVGHLCARDDRFFESLKYLATVGLDLDIRALLSGPNGEGSQPMTALEVSRAFGSLKCIALLESLRV